MKTLWTWGLVLVACSVTTLAHAQPSEGDFRFSLDVDVIGISGLELEREGGGDEQELSLFTVGNSATPAALGLGWALSSKTVVGARLGFAFRKEDWEGGGTAKATNFLIAPNLTLLPIGDETKLFIELSPILRIGHVSAGESDTTGVSGGAGIALGMLLFTSRGASLDLGFFFDATWGGATYELFRIDREYDARVLRGGVRLGLSLWE